MELGNMVFGNSRGRFEMPRGGGWEHELYRLFDAIDRSKHNKRDNSWRDYGVDFENETFYTMPYYWGDCNCGYEKVECGFKEQHGPDCYHTYVNNKLREKGWKDSTWLHTYLEEPEGMPYDKRTKIEDSIRKDACKKYGLSFPFGCAAHCTCDYGDRYAKYCSNSGYPNGHLDNCLLVRDNFHFKPDNIGIQWYKYPLRDSYISHEITLDRFHEIIDICISSLEDK